MTSESNGVMYLCTSLSLPHSQLMDKLNTDTEQAAVIADTTAVRISIHDLYICT